MLQLIHASASPPRRTDVYQRGWLEGDRRDQSSAARKELATWTIRVDAAGAVRAARIAGACRPTAERWARERFVCDSLPTLNSLGGCGTIRLTGCRLGPHGNPFCVKPFDRTSTDCIERPKPPVDINLPAQLNFQLFRNISAPARRLVPTVIGPTGGAITVPFRSVIT
jgi:hypothetical protein